MGSKSSIKYRRIRKYKMNIKMLYFVILQIQMCSCWINVKIKYENMFISIYQESNVISAYFIKFKWKSINVINVLHFTY